MGAKDDTGFYIVLISIHGLIRGEHLELGRDSDTGGQTLYVVELARALAARDDVARVDLMTRLVRSDAVDPIYAEPIESIGPNANIVRIEAGPDEYIRKEELWDHLGSFADNAAEYLRAQQRLPDVIHSHYGDAGYVGSLLSKMFGIPLVHTGHSLGRVKRMRLLANGISRDQLEDRYKMTRRIEAEEETLATAELVIASTNNEVEEQYGLYDCYHPNHMTVVPPGTNLDRFFPPDGSERTSTTWKQVRRHLDDPDKPIILAIARPDPRKNLCSLVIAYGESEELQKLANLVIVAGSREDIREMDEGSREVLTELLVLIDRYDLTRKIAFPKCIEDVPTMYRIAAAAKGVFVNPALTEPFGLTIIEAAASGVPVVATEHGGPTDIIGNCHNGLLVDPLDTEAIGEAIASILRSETTWKAMSDAGMDGVGRLYSWTAHAASYMEKIQKFKGAAAVPRISRRRRSTYRDRAVFTDIDQSLVGDPEALEQLSAVLRQNRQTAAFGIATGRPLESALRAIQRHKIPMPDILITATGTEIHYAPKLVRDTWWTNHINHYWEPRSIHRVLAPLPGITLQAKDMQSRRKLSYYIDPEIAPSIEEIQSQLYQADLNANLIMSFGQFLDVVPARASKGLALRYVANQLGLPLDHILVTGGSGADEDMMRGNTLAVVVENRHNEEISDLSAIENVFYATRKYAGGVLEAMGYYDFYGACVVPPPPASSLSSGEDE